MAEAITRQGRETSTSRPLWIWEPLLVFAASRLAVLVVPFLTLGLVPTHDGKAPPANLLIDAWIHWDAGWYLAIVQNGYWLDSDPMTSAQSPAFFPLYPLITRLVGGLTGDYRVAGLLVANLCLAVALVALFDLARRKLGEDNARWTIILLAFSPFALFFGSVYTESLFLLLAVASFWFAEREDWWLAGLCAGLCSATRLVGLGLAPSLVLLYFAWRHWHWRSIDRSALGLLFAPLGTALYAAYLWVVLGDPLLFYKTSAYGWRRYNIFKEGLDQLSPAVIGPGNYDLERAIGLAMALLWLLTIIPMLRRLGLGYACFVAVGVLVPLSAGLESLGRYVTVLFPAFMMLAACGQGRPTTRAVLLAGSAMLLGLFATLFVNYYWVV